MTALPIISASVNRAAYDGVFGHLFAMAVFKDQHRWRELLLLASGLRRIARINFSVVGRRIGASFRRLLPATETHVPTALQLDHEWLGFRFGLRINDRRRLHDHKLRRHSHWRERIVRIKRVAKENCAGPERAGIGATAKGYVRASRESVSPTGATHLRV